ncbi:MAG: hypothetical protein R3E89_12065 [Thiolinea sp.]
MISRSMPRARYGCRIRYWSADQLRLNVGRNSVRLNGVADERNGLDWQIDAPELSALLPSLDGQVRGNGNARGKLDGSRLSVQIARLDGRLQGFPLSARGGIRLRDGQLAADDLLVNVGANTLRVNGVVDERTGLAWQLDAQRLEQLSPAVDGQLRGRGTVLAGLDGKNVTLNIAELQGRSRVSRSTPKVRLLRDQSVLAANDLRVNVGANTLRVNGVVDERTGLAWQLDAQRLEQINPALDGQLRGRGNVLAGLDGQNVTLNIAELQGRVKGFPVNARGTVALRDGQQLSVSNLSLNAGANTLVVNGTLDENRGLDWRLDAQNLAQLHPAANGQLRGNGNIRGGAGRFTFHAAHQHLAGPCPAVPAAGQW